MKTSNWLLAALLLVLFTATAATDFLLKDSYAKLNLNDPFKNYQTVPILPFKVLLVSGGNGYAIEVKQADTFDMKVMNSRKGFLKTTQRNDTLIIQFTVSGNGNVQMAGKLPKGLLIACPAARVFSFTGTSTILRDWQSDSLQLEQAGNAVTSFNNVHARHFLLKGTQNSFFDFNTGNRADQLSFNLENNAAIYLNNILVRDVRPHMKDEAKIILSSQTSKLLFSEQP
jgi:hypothetical protein